MGPASVRALNEGTIAQSVCAVDELLGVCVVCDDHAWDFLLVADIAQKGKDLAGAGGVEVAGWLVGPSGKRLW